MVSTFELVVVIGDDGLVKAKIIPLNREAREDTKHEIRIDGKNTIIITADKIMRGRHMSPFEALQ